MKEHWPIIKDLEGARRTAGQLVQQYSDRCLEAIRCLEENLGDAPQFYGFPEVNPKNIFSTNMSERTGRELHGGA